MEYTHYYDITVDNEALYSSMVKGAGLIVKQAIKDGTMVEFDAVYMYSIFPDVSQCGGVREELKSFLTIEGFGSESCDAFVWPPKNGATHCKTKQLPYDEVVCACLLLAKHIYGEGVSLSSDGDWDTDWEKGRSLYNKVFDKEPTCPFEEFYNDYVGAVI
jgi:hypothetical protein